MEELFFDGALMEARIGVKAGYIERSLGLAQRSLGDKEFLKLPETQAVLRVLYHMPWVLEVAEHNFDPEKASLLLQREVINMKLRE